VIKLLRDLVMFSVVNRSVMLLLLVVALALVVLFVHSTQAALPFMYALF
jgi:hypothetical protein